MPRRVQGRDRGARQDGGPGPAVPGPSGRPGARGSSHGAATHTSMLRRGLLPRQRIAISTQQRSRSLQQ
eukprot:4270742-Pyramimonas_sp.AAC.1